jgi:hypothetical protein
MKKLLLFAALLLLASAADASMCIKCDQSTSYRCFMSIYGTKAKCDSPSDAGCFMWGACTASSDCADGCPFVLAGAIRSDDLQLASVSVTVEQAQKKPAATKAS